MFLPIAGFPGYRVSDDGVIESRHGVWGWGSDQWRPLTPTPDRHGHLWVTLYRNGGRQGKAVHTVVLESFVGLCPPGLECRHLDNNPANNALTNVRWDTREANQGDRVLAGTAPRGSNNGNAKLDEAKVLDMRDRFQRGANMITLLQEYGIQRQTFIRIIKKRTWTHV